MGNTRRFNPSRRQKVLGMKDRLKWQAAQIGALEGTLAARSAQLAATQMERPPDLDEWVAQAVTDMDPEELAQWEAMDEAEQEQFIEQLGDRINQSKAALTQPS